MKFRKATFYLSMKTDDGRVYAKKAEGYIDDNHAEIGLHKNFSSWSASHIYTGLLLPAGAATRTECLRQAKEMLEESNNAKLIAKHLETPAFKTFDDDRHAQQRRAESESSPYAHIHC